MSELAGEERELAIVGAYNEGTTLLKIEKQFDVSRATIYWVLEKHGVAPSRARKKDRLTIDGRQAAMLYELIEHQQRRIAHLETVLAKLDPTNGTDWKDDEHASQQ